MSILPRDSLVVITGLSGSGKSSLAFDTIYAEGQRRYVEKPVGLCAPIPGADAGSRTSISIEGLSPAISIEQKTTSRNPRRRSHGHRDLRLYAPAVRAGGRALFAGTGLPIESQTVTQMVDRIMSLPRHAPAAACAHRSRPQGRIQKGAAGPAQRGFQRVKIDGVPYENR